MSGTIMFARLETSDCVENETLLVLYRKRSDMDPAKGCSMHAMNICQKDLTQLIKRGIKIEVNG